MQCIEKGKKKLEECEIDFYKQSVFASFGKKKKKKNAIKIKNKIIQFIKNLLTYIQRILSLNFDYFFTSPEINSRQIVEGSLNRIFRSTSVSYRAMTFVRRVNRDDASRRK